MSVLAVPYVSQLDPVTGLGGANCGAASLSMAMAYRGVIAPTQGAMWYVADIIRDGIPDGRGVTGGYVTLTQLVACAAWFDLACRWLRSWPEVQASLTAGEPVILLVDNTALWPRQYPRSPAFDAHHFVLLTGYTAGAAPSADAAGDVFWCNDPLSVYARGPAPYTAASLVAAADLVGGVAAIALEPLALVPPEDDMATVTDLQTKLAALEGTASALRDQIAALREEVAVRTTERDTARARADEGVSTIAALHEDVEKPLRAEVAALKAEVAALTETLATTVADQEARIGQLEAQVREAVALAGRVTAQRPTRVDLVYVDGSLGYVPEGD